MKDSAKQKLAGFLAEQWGHRIDPQSLFDVQIKRIHEYKRQLMNAIHIGMLYRRLRDEPGLDIPPQVFFIAGKAAPGYDLAKRIVHLINDLAEAVNADPVVNRKLRLYFLPNYSVSMAERIIPATDLSEQISTAGKEASGTGNMKFMMNGALTVGTWDGANVEMAEEVGEENMFLFGLKPEEVSRVAAHYDPNDYCADHPEIEATLEMLFSKQLNPQGPEIYKPLRDALFTYGDQYMVLRDLLAYTEARKRAVALFRDKEEWSRLAILNIAASGKFSSDRSIAEYAEKVWRLQPLEPRG